MTLGNKHLTYENAKEYGELLLQNSLICMVPYNPYSEFEEDKYYCFVVS